MKKRLIALLLGSIGSGSAFGLVNLGEGQIDLNLQVRTFYDTEIRARNLGQEDFVFSVRPSLQYKRSSKNLDFSASIGLEGRAYLDYDEYNDTDVFFDLNISPKAEMQTSRFRFSGDVILSTETRSEQSVGEIVTINNYGASAELIYDPNRRFTIIGSAEYRQRDPDSDVYFKTTTKQAGVRIAVPMNESLDVLGGITYLDTKTDRPTLETDVSSETFTYFIGLDGQLSAKLSGSLSAGIQERSFDDATLGDTSNPYVSAELDWRVDDTTSYRLSASQGLGTTINNRSSDELEIRLRANRSLSRDLSASAFIGYERFDYGDREDKGPIAGASLTYQLVRYGSVAFECDYLNQSSTENEFDYDRFRIGVRFNGTW
ncbi:MAG: outer membrane beta-barrel protein [Puniceicoccaceae bacterium]